MALEAVTGRKHSSTIQVQQLKSALPLVPCLHHYVSSQVWLYACLGGRESSPPPPVFGRSAMFEGPGVSPTLSFTPSIEGNGNRETKMTIL